MSNFEKSQAILAGAIGLGVAGFIIAMIGTVLCAIGRSGGWIMIGVATFDLVIMAAMYWYSEKMYRA